MILNLKIIIILILSFHLIVLQSLSVIAVTEKIDGLEYGIRKLEDVPLQKIITKNYDLYELYFENKSDKTFSVPGYSIDLGVDYSNLTEINSLFVSKSQKKLAVFNIAAGAASIAFGGLAKTAATSAFRTVSSLRHKNINIGDNSNYLSADKTYILYPHDGLSLFLFVNKSLNQLPNTIRFVCHEEGTNVSNVVINNSIDLREHERTTNLNKSKEDVIADPNTEQYK